MGHMDLPVSFSELNTMYGKPKDYSVRDLIIETVTKTVRQVPHQVLSVPCVTHNSGRAKICAYMLQDVINDYSSEAKALAALMAVVSQSDCPLVAEFRKQVAICFADGNADQVDEVLI